MGIGSAIGGIASIGGSLIGSSAASDASDAQVEGYKYAADATKENTAKQIQAALAMYMQNRTDTSAWRKTGANAVNYLAQLLGVKAGGTDSSDYVTSLLNGDETYSVSGGTSSLTAPELKNYLKSGTSTSGTTDTDWEAFKKNYPYGTSDAFIRQAYWDQYGKEPNQSTSTSEYDYDAYNTALKDYYAALLAQQESKDSTSYGSNAALEKSGNVLTDLLGLGTGGTEAIQTALGKLPGYQFQLSEGQKAIERSAAARGGQLSGATMKALQAYGQDLGSTTYRNYLNDVAGYRNDELNRLYSLAGLGSTSTSNLGSQGTATSSLLSSAYQNQGNSLSSLYSASGNARASGYINSANALTGGLNGLSNSALYSSLTGGSSSSSGSNWLSSALSNLFGSGSSYNFDSSGGVNSSGLWSSF